MKQSNSTNGNPNATKPMPKQYGIESTGPKSQPQERLLQGIPVGLKNAWDGYEPDNSTLPYNFGESKKRSQSEGY